ncbi:MAG: sugar O-acetyltransferase [Erysipelotrichaceae bacterium]|nr:sugar O-acetyltransferase [Erysipelotrichaceae bacterium]
MEFEKMIKGEYYSCLDEELIKRRNKAQELCHKYNECLDVEIRKQISKELLNDDSKDVNLQGPINITYGCNLIFGENCYANFNFVAMDNGPITIGNNVMFGPNCCLTTAIHPLHYLDRNIKKDNSGNSYTIESTKPIIIKDNCWIGANVTVCPGVTINENCVIGAGSVVTKDIEANSLAYGNPCKVIRKITDEDLLK